MVCPNIRVTLFKEPETEIAKTLLSLRFDEGGDDYERERLFMACYASTSKRGVNHSAVPVYQCCDYYVILLK